MWRYAAQLNGAGVGPEETGHTQEQRSFAAADGTTDTDDFSGADIGVDAVEHIDAGVAPVDAGEERLPQSADD